MEIGYLNQVKAVLKSLVLSSPDKITVDRLNRDYREIEGEFIPFRRLGFNNLETFLRSIPDTLLILGSGHSACVYFVSSDKSRHIHHMIMEQRKPRKVTSSRSRPRNGNISSAQTRKPPMHRPPARNNNSFQAANVPLRSTAQQFSAHQVTKRNLSTRTVNVRDIPQVKQQQFNGNINQRRPSAHSNISASLPQPKGIHLCSLNALCEEPKKNTETDIKRNYSNLDKMPAKSTEAKDSENHSKNIDKIQSLLATTCHVTAPASRAIKIVSFSPDTQSHQKTSLSSALERTDALAGIHAPKPEIKLSKEVEKLSQPLHKIKSKGNPLTVEVMNTEEDQNVLITQRKTENESKINKFMQMLDISDCKIIDIDEAVPAFAANNRVFRIDFPPYTVPYGRKIPALNAPEGIEEGSCIGIFIAEIHNPFKFWFHIHKDEHELDILMHQIERFYTHLSPHELCIPIVCLNPGQVCAACYNGMWHRAEIVAAPINNCVKVSFVDYGTVSEVNINEIKYLASCFAQLPVQALRGCLSHIKPCGLHWSHEATKYFLSLVAEIMLYAKITEIDREKSVFHMVLCNTHGNEVIQINKELVVKRYALYNKDWQESKIIKNNGRRAHHPREDYPTFSMIERGEYPNFSELVELEQCGIDYEAIYDRIIFNKWATLNFHESVPEPIRHLPFFLQTTNPFRTDILFELLDIKVTTDEKN